VLAESTSTVSSSAVKAITFQAFAGAASIVTAVGDTLALLANADPATAGADVVVARRGRGSAHLAPHSGNSPGE
jgi:hypothetical protein